MLLLCFFLYFLNLNRTDLWPSHEARAAMDAQSILDTGDWLLPRLNDGTPELQKPPGFYWLVAGLGYLNGGTVDRICVRLPSAIAATMTILIVFFFLGRFVSHGTAWTISLISMSSLHWIASAHTGRIDMPLAAVVTATLVLSTYQPTSRVGKIAHFMGLAFGLTTALMLKGLIGWLMILSIWTVCGLIRYRKPDWELLPTPRLRLIPLFALLSLAMIAPWFWSVNLRTHGELFQSLIVHHHLQRAFGGADLETHPVWFYVPRLLFDFLPWSAIGLIGFFWRAEGVSPRRTAALSNFCFIAISIMFLGLSASRFKRADYLLPLYPWLAIATGLLLDSKRASKRKLDVEVVEYVDIDSDLDNGGKSLFAPRPRRAYASTLAKLPIYVFSLMFIGSLLFNVIFEPRYEAPYRVAEFAEAIRKEHPAPEELIFFRVEAHLLSWHLGKPLATILEWDQLRNRLGEQGEFLIREDYLEECRAQLKEYTLSISLRSADFCPVKPQRAYVWLKANKLSAIRYPLSAKP